MLNTLHDEQDALEESIAKARDTLRKQWKETLPKIFNALSEDSHAPDGASHKPILDALHLFAVVAAKEIGPIARSTLKGGVAFGKQRVAATKGAKK